MTDRKLAETRRVIRNCIRSLAESPTANFIEGHIDTLTNELKRLRTRVVSLYLSNLLTRAEAADVLGVTGKQFRAMLPPDVIDTDDSLASDPRRDSLWDDPRG